jgi:hypothetical protein
MAPEVITAPGFSADIVEFIRLLNRFKVRCVVVRGEAVIFHGYPRLTGDIDFFYERRPGNAARLFEALKVFWDNDVPGVKTANELLDPGVIIQFGRPPNRIDLHSQIDGVSFGSAWKSRLPVRLKTRSGSVRLSYIGIGPLRRNKRATSRAKDLDDLEHLAPLKKKQRKRKHRENVSRTS